MIYKNDLPFFYLKFYVLLQIRIMIYDQTTDFFS